MPEHNKGKLYCSYIQRKADSTILFPNNEVHESLNVIYLKGPQELLQDFGSIQSMTDWNVTIEFDAHPQPKPQDVIWAFKTDQRTIEVPTEAKKTARKGHYIAHPIEKLGETEFSATLTIEKIQENESNLQHFLIIKNPALNYQQEHHFIFQILDNKTENIEENSAVNSSTTTVIVVIVVLVLASIITASSLLFYAKKNDIWCFDKKIHDSSSTNADPEMSRPLENNAAANNMLPIIKRDYRRPTAL